MTTTTSTTEPKPAETEGGTLLNKDAPKAPEGAPETYSAFTVPDGFTLDETVSKEASELFKALNLPQEGAQKLVDFYVSKTREAFEQPYNAYNEMREGWRTEVQADPEIGGRKLDQVKANVAKMYSIGFGDAKLEAAFREAIDLTGIGDNPAFIRGLAKLAQRFAEGTVVPGGKPSAQAQPNGKPPSAAHALFPNLP